MQKTITSCDGCGKVFDPGELRAPYYSLRSCGIDFEVKSRFDEAFSLHYCSFQCLKPAIESKLAWMEEAAARDARRMQVERELMEPLKNG
jgi:hypothetical protein